MPTLSDILHTMGQIPPLSSYKRPLFIGPHPDDIEFGCGGLISKYKETGAEVHYVILTDGAAAYTPGVTPKQMRKMREAESFAAAAFMGVKTVDFGGLPDGGDYSVNDAIRALCPYVLKYKPDIIFGPDPHLRTECHTDHLKCAEAVKLLSQIAVHPESMRHHGIPCDGASDPFTIAYYFTDDPNVKEEISEANLGEKIQALRLHSSQMQDPSTELLLNFFMLKAQDVGAENALGPACQTGLAEDYQVLIPLVQHVFMQGVHYNK